MIFRIVNSIRNWCREWGNTEESGWHREGRQEEWHLSIKVKVEDIEINKQVIIESSREIYTSALLTTSKSLTAWITTNRGKFLKRWEYQTTWPASWEICMQVKKQQLQLDMEQQTDSKLWKEYIKAVYCHPAYLTYMQSTSCEISGWMKWKLESTLLGEISITSDTQMTPPLWQEAKN